jgi:hypothetical protein
VNYSFLTSGFLFFPDGAGVPPGTKPETCLTCRGSGFVSSFSNTLLSAYWFYLKFLCFYLFFFNVDRSTCKLLSSGCSQHAQNVEVLERL